MLKTVREMAVENPWVLRFIMGVIAVTFVVTMGWFGFEAPTSTRVALVDGTEVTVKEYRTAYNRAVEYYRQTYKDQFNDEFLKKLKLEDQVLNELIERTLWVHEAKAMGLIVTDQEISKAVVDISSFQKAGKFDPVLYRRVLEINHTNPEAFEKGIRQDMLVEKAKRMIRDAVVVTNDEVETAFPTLAAATLTSTLPPTQSPEERERMKQFLQFQKQEKSLKAYGEAMKKKADVEINKQAL